MNHFYKMLQILSLPTGIVVGILVKQFALAHGITIAEEAEMCGIFSGGGTAACMMFCKYFS